MVFQYVHDPKATEVERKLEELRQSKSTEYVQNSINDCLKQEITEPLNWNIKPNENFIKAHNARKKKENEEQKHKEFLNSIDEQGHKLEKIYESEEFQRLHDPNRIYSSKGNYKDLALKVYRDIDDTQIFLKTLYYSNLRSEDYRYLIDLFNHENRMSKFIQIRNLAGGVIGLGGAYLLSNKLTLKFKTSILFCAGSFIGTYSLMHYLGIRGINKRLNVKSLDIAKKYPEIKLSSIEYGKVNI